MRPLKAKLGALHLFGTFWQFLAIFAFLAKLDNSKHFEPYLFFWPFWPFLVLRPLWPSKAKNFGLYQYNQAIFIIWANKKKNWTSLMISKGAKLTSATVPWHRLIFWSRSLIGSLVVSVSLKSLVKKSRSGTGCF